MVRERTKLREVARVKVVIWLDQDVAVRLDGERRFAVRVGHPRQRRRTVGEGYLLILLHAQRTVETPEGDYVVFGPADAAATIAIGAHRQQRAGSQVEIDVERIASRRRSSSARSRSARSGRRIERRSARLCGR